MQIWLLELGQHIDNATVVSPMTLANVDEAKAKRVAGIVAERLGVEVLNVIDVSESLGSVDDLSNVGREFKDGARRVRVVEVVECQYPVGGESEIVFEEIETGRLHSLTASEFAESFSPIGDVVKCRHCHCADCADLESTSVVTDLGSEVRPDPERYM